MLGNKRIHSRTLALVGLLTIACSSNATAQDQVEVFNDTLQVHSDSAWLMEKILGWLPTSRQPRPSASPSATELERILLGTLDTASTLIKDPDFYCIIHLVSWSSREEISQSWFVYRGDKHRPTSWSVRDISAQRFYGASSIGLLYIYLHPLSDTPEYRIGITPKHSTPVQNLLSLLQFATARPGFTSDITTVKWAGGVLTTRYKTSEISVEGYIPGETSPHMVGKQTFVNEAKTRWDIGVGIPVLSVRELSYEIDSGRVTTTSVDRAKAFALLEFFPVPIDPRRTGFRIFPLLFGVSLAEKPFDHLLIGTGVGLKIASVFAGVALSNDHKPKTLQLNDNATDSELARDRSCHYTAKFVFGLNVSVTQFLELVRH